MLRWLGAAMAWTMVGLLALITSVVVHLALPLARDVGLEILGDVLDGQLQGEIRIGAIHNLRPHKIVVSDVVVTDPQGREVIRADRVALTPDWRTLRQGTFRIARARLRGAAVTLYVSEDESSVSLVDAFLPRVQDDSPSPPRGRPIVVVDDILLDEVRVAGDVPGFSGLEVTDVRIAARIVVEDAVVFHFHDGRGVMRGPYPGESRIERIVGQFSTDMADGLNVYTRVRRGPDQVRGRVRVTRVDDDTPVYLDITTALEPLSMATLAEMEIPGTDVVAGTYRGHARLHGPVDALVLSADLRSEGGRALVDGSLPSEGAMRFRVRARDLELSSVVPAAPRARLLGVASIELDPEAPDGTPGERRVAAAFEPTRLTDLDIDLPALEMVGTLADDALLIERLDAAPAGGDLRVDGRVGYEGDLDLGVRLRLPALEREPNVRRYAPELRGAIDADLRIRSRAGLEDLGGEGQLELSSLRYGTVRASRVAARGRVFGRPPAPRARLSLEAQGFEVGGFSIGNAEVSLDGGPAGYDVSLATRDPETGLTARVGGRVHSSEEELSLRQATIGVDPGDGEWSGQVGILRLRYGRFIELEPLVIARGSERVIARGRHTFRGPDEIEVRAVGVRLDHLRGVLGEGFEELGGRVDLQLVARGDLARDPEGRLSLRIQDGSLGPLRDLGGQVELDIRDHRVDADVSLDLRESGRLSLRGPIRLSPESLRRPERILEDARFEAVRVEADHLDPAALFAIARMEPVVAGRVSTSVELSGALLSPDVPDSTLIFERIEIPGWDPLRAKARLTLEGGRANIRRLWVADANGELISMEGALPLDLRSPPEDVDAFWASLAERPWSASIRVPPRRLDSWPAPLRDHLPPGIAASLSVTADGGPEGRSVDIEGAFRWVEAAAEAQCAAELRPQVRIRGHLEGDILEARAIGFFGNRLGVEVDAWAELPMDEWVARGEVARFPETELVARLRPSEMGDIPWLCEIGRGPISGQLVAKDLLTGSPTLGAVLDVPALRLWEGSGREGSEGVLSQPHRLHLRAGSHPDQDALTACLIVGQTGVDGTPGVACRETGTPASGELIARGIVPVRFAPDELLPNLMDEPLVARANLANVRLAPILRLVPALGGGDAIVDGQIEATGNLDELRLVGALDILEGHLQVRSLGQHLHDIQGRLELHGDEAVLPADQPLRARDGSGTALIHGRVGLDGYIPRDVDLSITADSFPVRREGAVLASLTGAATLRAEIASDRASSVIRTRGFGVRLPEQTAGSLQPLDPHPDVLVVGQPRPFRPEGADAAYALSLELDASDPFWVRRNDFAALVTAQISAHYEEPSLRISGEARIRRGTFEIFGKRFELSEGQLTFGGTSELDPQVNITAVYEIPGRRGGSVTVSVTGRLTDPVVEFTSTETNDRAEIIALLIAGSRRETGTEERDATQQAASFLAGLTAGILTLGLRQEFGDVIPVLAIESQGLGGTRVRAGFNADSLIPDFLREFVTGAYIEGFFTAAADGADGGQTVGGAAGAGGVGMGVTVEFSFPHNFLFRGTYVPVDHGSVDILFEP